MILRRSLRRSGLASVRQAATRLCWSAVWLIPLLPVKAVLFYSTGDPDYHTNAPATRSLTNSGWQYQGAWGGYSGTVISSNCFITVKHAEGAVGDWFAFQGTNYPALAAYDDPDTELRIWRVAGRFPTNAPLYTRRNEPGKSLVVIGRGTRRGVEVRLNEKLKGWEWGDWDGVQRWGQNKISGLQNGGPGVGEVLQVAFHAGRNEAHLSVGDSGGAIFIKDGKTFKLAGINYGVDGPYNTTNSGPGFEAALFDQRGFYVWNSAADAWTLTPLRTGRIGSSFYAIRISSRIDWINGILSEPAP
jgi:hypothetical protein